MVSGSASTVYTELRVKRRKKTKTKGKKETKKRRLKRKQKSRETLLFLPLSGTNLDDLTTDAQELARCDEF